MVKGADDTWTYSTDKVAPGTLEFKPLLDDSAWSRGPNYTVTAGTTVDVYPHFNVTQGQWSQRWTGFASALLGNSRAVWVYLPPTYVENATARFPDVYMHDGQNLFDPNVAFGGTPWWVQNAIDAAAENGTFREAIVVGPEATGDRIGEYTPTASSQYPGSGKGATYLRMLVEELEPKADAMLHLLIADLGDGTSTMTGKNAKQRPALGLVKVAKNLDQYGKHFDHPGFKPVGVGH